MQPEISADYIQTIVTPAVLGGVIGVLVLASYLLYCLVSACCKCWSSKRGCCQRAKDTKYRSRLPYIAMVAIGAVLGLAGGALVVQNGGALATTVRDLADLLIAVVCPPPSSPPRQNPDYIGTTYVQALSDR